MAFIMKFALVLVATLFLAGSVKAGQPVLDVLSPLMCKTGLTDQQITSLQRILGCLTELLKSVIGEDTLLKYLMACAELPTTSTLKDALKKVCKEGVVDASVLSCLDNKIPAIPDKTTISEDELTSTSICLTKQTRNAPTLPKVPCPVTILCYLGIKDPRVTYVCNHLNMMCPRSG